ncbi:tetratricopeptide repeat protein, partial [Embleya sp. NPDC008237]|uniref:tetratricopeptide repeat protein n=1 Tax=Embleya sp. NPDC008237 TaxID=3363978 RepID=UPI0036E4D9F6
MAIGMPDEQRLPPGARRELVIALHALYTDAGRPGTRAAATAISRRGDLPSTVSHETLSALLHGRAVPDWPRMESVVRHLAGASVRRPDPDETVLRFHDLWRTERDAPRPRETNRLTAGALVGACRPDPADAEAVLRETGLDPDTELSTGEVLAILIGLGAQWQTLCGELADAHAQIARLRNAPAPSSEPETPTGPADVGASDVPTPAETDTTRPDPAELLRSLGFALSNAGRHKDAEAAYTEAVAIHRSLAQHDPATHLLPLADSLHALGFALSNAGRHKDAEAAYTEAVAIRRSLAEHDPTTHLPPLSASL